MNTKKVIKNGYKVARSVLFTTICLIVFIYVGLYITLSIPGVQNKIRDIGETQLSSFLGSKVTVGKLSIMPFNEVIINNLKGYTPDNELFLEVNTLGAGISLYDLIFHQKIVITYAELTGLDGKVWQKSADTPLNIQFLIDAFSPKDKNKPPAKFNLDIRNIVIRKSAISYDREFCERKNKDDLTRFDANHIAVKNFSADVAIPVLCNDSVWVDLRNLAFEMTDGPDIRHLSCRVKYNPHNLQLANFILRTNNSQLNIADLDIEYESTADILKHRTDANPLSLSISNSYITPSDFKCFFGPLSSLDKAFDLTAELRYSSKELDVSKLTLFSKTDNFLINIKDASVSAYADDEYSNISSIARSNIEIGNLLVNIPARYTKKLPEFLPKNSRNTKWEESIERTGDILLEASGRASLADLSADIKIEGKTGAGNFNSNLFTELSKSHNLRNISFDISTTDLDISNFATNIPLSNLTSDVKGDITLREAALSKLSTRNIDGIWEAVKSADVTVDIEEMRYNNHDISHVNVDLTKTLSDLLLTVAAPQSGLGINLTTQVHRQDNTYFTDLNADIDNLLPGLLMPSGSLHDEVINGAVAANISGSTLNDLQGKIALSGFRFDSELKNRHIALHDLSISSYLTNGESRSAEIGDTQRITELSSDWIDGRITTSGEIKDIIAGSKEMARRIMPGLLTSYIPAAKNSEPKGNVSFAFTIDKSIADAQLFTLPATPLYHVTIGGDLNLDASTANLVIDAPYLRQGRDKLIRGTRMDLKVADDKANLNFHSTIPTKKGILDLFADIAAYDDTADVNLHFNPLTKSGFYGDLKLQAAYLPQIADRSMQARIRVLPSFLYLNDAEWYVGQSTVTYADNKLTVRDFNIAHNDQHISINGVASKSEEDMMVVDLNDINLDYIFDTLNINYVSFGGTATGQAIATGAFSPNLDAHTRNLTVKDLSYNHCVLGDAKMYGDFNIKEKRVGIEADVAEAGRHVADIKGGIWIGGKDSLSFGINADKVRINFLQTFMHAFSSEVSGRASGEGLLYGTFKDIDMTGKFFADTISVKVDYTNVTYSGRDSVTLTPGKVSIPAFTLYDKYKNTVRLSGELTHNCFHDPYFHFDVRNADKVLIYDTNASMNPIWYGKLFGTGSGIINGTPEKVEIIADMTTEKNSDFTFVIDDSLEAADYTFLTFTDRRKKERELLMASEQTEEDAIVAAFNRKVQEQNESSMAFSMDIRATVTPAVNLSLIMDPSSGDKITARGGGPINITYSSVNDEMKMYGKYTLDEGKYNFTLQDLILKDFIIKPGSSVAFNGDPMAADLNIRAAYRVNTNITDLDQSFANDRDLNRTNVPVDAMLIVTGDMTNPDISFDIEFPTLNEEVAQKVRSIISSDDMMSRQIIYLLALNRFYPSEYTGNSGSGGEWASVASSTISSQLQNILGQLTDKFTVAPSLHSDKGDFSDLEFDVALSSRLFNNRLLINGNLGYRDPSTSSTTFVGDFDIEYLLTSNGNLRLKAYNHFNDQNYYLKSALTTQGLGLIFRRDFDELIPRKKKTKKK